MAERITFPSSTGQSLAGIIDLPDGEVRGWGVFAHGFTLGKDCPAASRICKQLASEGIGMLRFDNLGLGESEGDWGDGSFSHKVADTVRAVEFMNDSGREVHLLVGHSFGGSAAHRRRARLSAVAAVAIIGAPFEPAHVERNYDALMQRIEDDGEATFLDRRQGAHPQAALHRGRPRGRPAGADQDAASGVAGDAFPDRQHRRHRQRQRDFPGGTTSPQLRLARRRRPPAHRQEPGRARRADHQRVGRPVPVTARRGTTPERS